VVTGTRYGYGVQYLLSRRWKLEHIWTPPLRDMQQQALVAEVVQSFRRFKNLPEAGDAAAIKAAMSGQKERLPPEAQSKTSQ